MPFAVRVLLVASVGLVVLGVASAEPPDVPAQDTSVVAPQAQASATDVEESTEEAAAEEAPAGETMTEEVSAEETVSETETAESGADETESPAAQAAEGQGEEGTGEEAEGAEEEEEAENVREYEMEKPAGAKKPKKFDINEVIKEPLFEFKMGERRDIFSGPIAVGPDEKPIFGSRGKIKPFVARTAQEQGEIISEMEELLARINVLISQGEYESAIGLNDMKLAPLLKNADESSDAKLQARLDAVKAGARKIESAIADARLAVLIKQSESYCKRMDVAFSEANYEEVLGLGKKYGDLFEKSREAMLNASLKKKQTVMFFYYHAQKLVQRAGIRQEFASKTVELKGVSWSPSQSLAVLNDTSVRVGDQIEGARVTEISREKVTLDYKGEEFEFFSR